MTKTTKKKRLNLNLREKKAYLIEATKKNREVLSLLVLEREIYEKEGLEGKRGNMLW